MWGGAAFSSAGVTVGHAIAHALGGVLQVPHSRAVAIAIGVNLRFNAETCQNAYAELAGACGIGGASPAEQAARFVEEIQSLLVSVGLPDRAAVPVDAPADLINRLVENAQQSTAIGLTLNPKKVTPEALAGLFEDITASPPARPIPSRPT
jgi:alcohol dehydrogenase class IV